jgi:nucleoid DNA-binding protein
MTRQDLGRALARKQHVSRAEAQDQLDALFHSIKTSLRLGKTIELPGIGRLVSSSSPSAKSTSTKNLADGPAAKPNGQTGARRKGGRA